MLDSGRIDRIYQYVLATARQLDDFQHRELGPIHLLKYAYLADLAYASAGLGSFTGADWRFYHFGPWSQEAAARIEPALLVASAKKKTISSKFADDFVRYSFEAEDEAERLARQIEAQIPITIAGALAEAVKRHGSDTADLLRHVYLTSPMLRAAPGETLVLQPEISTRVGPLDRQEFDRKIKTARDKIIAAARDALKTKLEERRQRASQVQPAPRYDEVFFAGTAFLDSLAGRPLENRSGIVDFEDSVWNSEQRREPDVS